MDQPILDKMTNDKVTKMSDYDLYQYIVDYYILSTRQTDGVTTVCIVTHYLTEQIEQYVDNSPYSDLVMSS